MPPLSPLTREVRGDTAKNYLCRGNEKLTHYDPKQSLKLFEERNVRTIWDDTQEKWYFSVVDVIQVLTENDYQTARKYWKVLKGRILAEAGQPVTICYQFKLRAADGKMRGRI